MQPPDIEPPDEIPVIRPALSRPAAAAPEATDGAPRPGERSARPGRRVVVLGVLALMVALALGVVFVLPDLLAPPPGPAVAPATTAVPDVARGDVPARAGPRAPAPRALSDPAPETDARARAARRSPDPAGPDAERLAREKREAETGLAEALRAKAALDASEAAVWAPAAWPQVLERLAAADALFGAARFTEALAGYQEVVEAFAALDASRPERLDRALAAGAEALAAGDGPAAESAFRIALALDPGNEVAAPGAQRARTIEQVLDLMAEGEAFEAAGDLEQARERYAAAGALDPHYGAAGEAGARVEAEILARAFAAAMSAALDAIERGALDEAARALEGADALVPGAPEARDARARILAVRQLRRIEARRREAESHASAERWTESASAYAAALAIDANLAFAIAGKARSEALARLHAEIDALAASPERLADSAPLNKARKIIADARGLPERGPALSRKLATLEALVAAAGQPVAVLLLSDGATEVTVYRVGRLGAFESRQLRLRPGRYVAFGSRPGYRDVRVEFEIAPGRAAAPVLVRCEEAV